MDESHFLGVANPLNLYGICKVWHTGVLKVLVASENVLLSAMALEDEGSLSWIFENEAILRLPERAQVISVATANPLMIDRAGGSETTSKPQRRCLVGVTYCIPPAPQEIPPPEPEPAPVVRAAPVRPTGSTSSFVSVLQAARPPPQAPAKPTESAPATAVPPRFFFSILGANSFENDHWSTIVQDSVTFELPYAPFVLAKYAPPNSSSVLFMLSGADRKLHIFNQHADVDADDTQNGDLGKVQDDTARASAEKLNRSSASLKLPLLDQYPSPVVSIDILDAMDGKLYVIVGCQDGSIVLTSGDSSGVVCSHVSTSLDGPITSVKIYQIARNRSRGSEQLVPAENDQNTNKSGHPSVRRLAKHIHRNTFSTASSGASTPGEAHSAGDESSTHGTPVEKVTRNEFAINVVVASAVGFAAVFRNVAEQDFGDFQLLPDSDKHDAVLGLAVSDIDHDGHVEILIGTYGQRLLAYAETKGKHSHSRRLATTNTSSTANNTTSNLSKSNLAQTVHTRTLSQSHVSPLAPHHADSLHGTSSHLQKPPTLQSLQTQTKTLLQPVHPVDAHTALAHPHSSSSQRDLQAQSPDAHSAPILTPLHDDSKTERSAASSSTQTPLSTLKTARDELSATNGNMGALTGSHEEATQATEVVQVGGHRSALTASSSAILPLTNIQRDPIDVTSRDTDAQNNTPKAGMLSPMERESNLHIAGVSPDVMPLSNATLDTPDVEGEDGPLKNRRRELMTAGRIKLDSIAATPQSPSSQDGTPSLNSADNSKLGNLDATTPSSHTTEASQAISEDDPSRDVGARFAAMVDRKNEDYRRENVVVSVFPANTTHRGASNAAQQSSTSNTIVDFRNHAPQPAETSSILPTPTRSLIEHSVAEHATFLEEARLNSPSPLETNYFSLLWHRSFNHPIYQIMCDDFVHDGTTSVIASTLYGVHLLRCDFEGTVAKAQRRLQLLSDIVKLERQLYRQERQRVKDATTTAPTSVEGAI